MKILVKTVTLFVIVFIIDQFIKFEFVNGFTWDSECITLSLVYNYGVAFSMFEFLADKLKYIQIGLMLAGIIYLLMNKDVFVKYSTPIALLFAGGASNILDRFIHGGVVDYVYWHCGFDFAIFNLADVIIDLAVVIIFYIQFSDSKKEKSRYNFD